MVSKSNSSRGLLTMKSRTFDVEHCSRREAAQMPHGPQNTLQPTSWRAFCLWPFAGGETQFSWVNCTRSPRGSANTASLKKVRHQKSRRVVRHQRSRRVLLPPRVQPRIRAVALKISSRNYRAAAGGMIARCWSGVRRVYLPT